MSAAGAPPPPPSGISGSKDNPHIARKLDPNEAKRLQAQIGHLKEQNAQFIVRKAETHRRVVAGIVVEMACFVCSCNYDSD